MSVKNREKKTSFPSRYLCLYFLGSDLCAHTNTHARTDVLATMSIFGVRRVEENNEVNLVTVFTGRLKLEDPSGIPNSV